MKQATLYVDEDTLTRLMTYIPKEDKELRDYFQRAGENIFKW